MSAPAGADVVVAGISKGFGRISALREVSLHVSAGEAVTITGRSGSGKSTLLALIGGLEQPDTGEVRIDGRALWREPNHARARRDVVGFVFQRHLLLESLSARANVEVPLIGARVHHGARRERALMLLDEVGLADRADHLPSELSGGERQRVAVARALANEPRLLLADEPTGALDSATSERVLDLLFRLRDRLGMTMIVVSYDSSVGQRADRTITIIDGAVVPGGGQAPAAGQRTDAGASPASPSAQHAAPSDSATTDGQASAADVPQASAVCSRSQ